MIAAKLVALTLLNGTMWGSAALLFQEGGVNQENIFLSLPVFVVSLLGTISGTWVVARWLYVRERRIERVERKLDVLLSKESVRKDEI